MALNVEKKKVGIQFTSILIKHCHKKELNFDAKF